MFQSAAHQIDTFVLQLHLLSANLTPEKGELVGSLMGDKGTFKVQRRHGYYNGYDLSRYRRCTMSICFGKDKSRGSRLSGLLMKSYGVHGSTYLDGREWRFWCSSSRAFRDLSTYYRPDWSCRSWRVTAPIFRANRAVKEAVIRGYFNADGYPNFSVARNEVALKATTVNCQGINTMSRLLQSLGYQAHVYRRYKNRNVWELCIARQDDVLRFYEFIQFGIRRKQRKLRLMLERKGLLT